MAQIWTDQSNSISNIPVCNVNEAFRFQWNFVTFSGETQGDAQVRWRKANTFSSVRDRIQQGDTVWSMPLTIERFEDTTTWVLSGGQYVPPASGRRYSNRTTVDFPVGYFPLGMWFIQVRAITYDSAGNTDGTWGGWSTHCIEFVDYTQNQYNQGSAPSVVVGPKFPNEGQYAFNVEVMSEAGVTSLSPDSNTFNVWETNKYLYDGSNLKAVPELSNDGTMTYRVKRTT